jgi:hypothetical protein
MLEHLLSFFAVAYNEYCATIPGILVGGITAPANLESDVASLVGVFTAQADAEAVHTTKRNREAGGVKPLFVDVQPSLPAVTDRLALTRLFLTHTGYVHALCTRVVYQLFLVCCCLFMLLDNLPVSASFCWLSRYIHPRSTVRLERMDVGQRLLLNIKMIDKNVPRERLKIGLIYVANGQELQGALLRRLPLAPRGENVPYSYLLPLPCVLFAGDILHNDSERPSALFNEFVSALAWDVQLDEHRCAASSLAPPSFAIPADFVLTAFMTFLPGDSWVDWTRI